MQDIESLLSEVRHKARGEERGRGMRVERIARVYSWRQCQLSRKRRKLVACCCHSGGAEQII